MQRGLATKTLLKGVEASCVVAPADMRSRTKQRAMSQVRGVLFFGGTALGDQLLRDGHVSAPDTPGRQQGPSPGREASEGRRIGLNGSISGTSPRSV